MRGHFLAATLFLLWPGTTLCQAAENAAKPVSSSRELGELSSLISDAATCEDQFECLFSGKCKRGSCECPEGTEGDRCEKIPGCDALSEICKKGNGYCTYDANAENFASCRCLYLFQAFDEVRKICTPTCKDDSHCKNSGKCNKKGSCECPEGTKGDNCDKIPGCDALQEVCQKDHRYCDYDPKADNHASCRCLYSFQRFDPVKKVCLPTCEEDSQCLNSGKCQRGSCECPEGTQGDLCESIPGCEILKDVCKKGNDYGFCEYDASAENHAKCSCRRHYQEFDPVEKICKTVCKDDSLCRNSGKCRNGSCECPEGTEGNRCQYVPGCDALEDTCQKFDGSCVYDSKAENQATCSCPGLYQEFDPVKKICKTVCKDDYNCENWGKCNKGSCVCPEGTEGDRCQYVPGCDALEDTCKKLNGFCYYDAKAENHATCSCPVFKKFDPVEKICSTCKDDFDCRNSGKCKEGSCECPKGTEGDRCEKIPGCDALEDVCKRLGGWCEYDADVENHSTCYCPGIYQQFDPVEKICKKNNEYLVYMIIPVVLIIIIFIFMGFFVYRLRWQTRKSVQSTSQRALANPWSMQPVGTKKA